MTAVSFILGVLPLLIATGAGAASRRALGTAVFAGMVAATAAGVLFIPVFYVLVQKVRDRRMPASGTPVAAPTGGGDTDDGAAPVPAGHGAARNTLGIVLLAAWCGTAACATVGPDYVRPESPLPDGAALPDAWRAQALSGLDTGEARLQRWWELFDDATLVRLVERAQTANPDVRLAVARVLESRAIVGVAAGESLPFVDTTGGVSVARGSAATLPFGVNPEIDTLTSVGVDLSWELDLFGRIARSIEAALADYDTSVEDVGDVLVSLSAAVALNYIDARTLQERLVVTRDNVRAQEESLQLTRDRFAAGLTSELDVAQAESNLYDTESRIPALERALTAAFNRLAILLAEPPGALTGDLRAGGAIPAPRESATVGIPADLVRQRPDLRRAERRLAAQTARIGVAAADLYPRFSLGGSFSFDAGNIGDATGFGWSILPGLRWNLFDRARIRSRINVEEARATQALVDYERTMLDALEEVEDAMVAYGREQERRAWLRQAVAASERAVALVRTQYLAGLTDFQNVLDSQRTLFALSDQLADANGAVVQHLVRLYSALGGGWDVASTPGPGPAAGAP